jgi:CheY-like chemotaxis protein
MHFANSGEVALEKLADGIEPALIAILSEINMPGMDGLTLLDEVKKRRPDISVMRVTAYGDDERRRMAATKLSNDYATLSEGLVAVDGDPVHDPAIAIVVVQGIVLYAAIVPKRDRTRLPAEAARVFRPDGVLEEKLHQRTAFVDSHILEADREVPVDVQAFPACLRVGADNRVLSFPMCRLAAQNLHRP